ncbi:MAG TPA: acetate/propionate family kinase [Casimicrobiaceae bacterium]|nr:acetate/propionate family kinase [Casimicrobiaceae bacterium]
MRDAIAVVNAGSSSLRYCLFAIDDEALTLISKDHVEATGGHDAAVRQFLGTLDAAQESLRVVAVGHRVVHGGTRHSSPVIVDAALLDELQALVPLAPLHQPHNIAPIRKLREVTPDLLQVACFDTAFHRTQSPLAQAFALPPSIVDRGVRRYGFHGLSCEYIASALPSIDASAARGRVVIAHLGNGASLCALRDGKSVASTMGLTALDGLMMGTRCGALDPGVILYLMNTLGMEARSIETLLYHESGLLGVSQLSSDMRALESSSDPRARFAIELFCYRAIRELGSLVAALGGLDALVFTAGIGENSSHVRAAIVDGAAWLGMKLDAKANASHALRITTADSALPAYVIATNEELVIARHARSLLDV